MENFSKQDKFAGLIINEIESLGKEEKKLLSKSYPGIDFSQVYIIEHNRSPASMVVVGVWYTVGVILALLGVFMLKSAGGKDTEPVSPQQTSTLSGKKQ